MCKPGITNSLYAVIGAKTVAISSYSTRFFDINVIQLFTEPTLCKLNLINIAVLLLKKINRYYDKVVIRKLKLNKQNENSQLSKRH